MINLKDSLRFINDLKNFWQLQDLNLIPARLRRGHR